MADDVDLAAGNLGADSYRPLDWNRPKGYTDERVRDVIAAALAAGTGVTITVNDPGDTITIAASVAYTDEQVRDVIGAALVAGTGMTITVNDALDTITLDTASGFPITNDNGSVTRSVSVGSTSITVEADDNSSNYEALFRGDANEAGTQATASLEASTPTHTGSLQMFVHNTTGPRVRFISNSNNIDVFLSAGSPNSSVTAAYVGSLCVDVTNKQVWIATLADSTHWVPLAQELYLANAAASGTVTVNYNLARVHRLTMTGNITTLTLTAPLTGWAAKLTFYLVQGGAGSFTVAWPASVKWPGGAAPTLSTAVGAVDKVELETFDGGTTWFGNLIGSAYA